MFYFAAASYAEMARRVAPERAAAGFLRARDRAFASALQSLSPACGPREQLAARVREAVEPMNIVGLCDTGKRNWYGADAADAIAGAAKLGVAPETVAAALAALGLCR
jgi:tetracycline 7-halogenase / FADH2 O2-dependent halogenase